MRVSDGPVGARGTRFDGPASLDVPVRHGARGDVGSRPRRADRAGARPRGAGQGRRRAAGADRQPPPHADRRPQLRVHERGPRTSRRAIAVAYVRGLQSRGRGRVHQALRRQRHRVRTHDDRLARSTSARCASCTSCRSRRRSSEAGVRVGDDGVQPDQRAVRRDSVADRATCCAASGASTALVMSDWFGCTRPPKRCAAGLDLEMPGPTRYRGAGVARRRRARRRHRRAAFAARR